MFMRSISMKGVMILVCLFLISSVSAIPTLNFYNEKINQEETVTGNITGINQTLTASDLKFFEERREVSFDKNLISFEGNYYFSIIFNRPGNFSMKIGNVLYYDNETLKSSNLEKNLEVEKKDNATKILSIKPGVIFTSKEFELSLTNMGEQVIDYSYGKNNKSSLEVGETERIKVFPSEKFSLFQIKSYKTFLIPVVYFGPNKNNTTNSTEEKIISLGSSPKQIDLQKGEGEKISFVLELFNLGTENLTRMTVLTGLDFLKMSNMTNLEGKTSLNLTVEGTAIETGVFQDNLTISYTKNKTTEELIIPVTIYVFKANASEEEIRKVFSCIDFGGRVCPATEVCDGNMSQKIEGCCLGFCQEVKVGNNSNFFVGILIIVFLGIIGFAIYKKFKGVIPKNKLISS